jgi:hypothetical protein
MHFALFLDSLERFLRYDRLPHKGMSVNVSLRQFVAIAENKTIAPKAIARQWPGDTPSIA